MKNFIMAISMLALSLILFVALMQKIHKRVKLVRMDSVTVTAYCPCNICNLHWAGWIATGESMKTILSENKNICAVDPEVIPIGSQIIYNGVIYWALDVGSKVKGKHIDIFLKTHKATVKFGVKRQETIFIIKETK